MTDPERLLALNYVPKTLRSAVSAFWQLDETLGKIIAGTTEPMIGQMRLTWWFDRLTALDVGNVPAEPLLQTLADRVLPHDVTGSEMAALVEGWEALLEPLPLSEAELSLFAEKRGGTLFALSTRLMGGKTDPKTGGEVWALVDFASRCSDPETAERAIAMALTRSAVDSSAVDSSAPKPLRILTRLAKAKARRSTADFHDPLNRFVFLRAVLG
ncbi:hypothetical protein BH09PSE3_BH09PSE3_07850 [soil metagenome]